MQFYSGKEYLTFDDVLIRPAKTVVSSRDEVSILNEVIKGIHLHFPVFASPMDTVVDSFFASKLNRTGGAAVLHRFQSIESQKKQAIEIKDSGPIIAAAVGINKEDYLERTYALKNHINVIVIDVAQGWSTKAMEAMHNISTIVNPKGIKIVVGSIATPEAALDLAKTGIPDALRVGIGNGNVCSTRVRTGIGVPQLSAISEIRKALHDHWPWLPKTPYIICDGGIRDSGDIVKALAAGADSVMIGNLFAQTIESASKKNVKVCKSRPEFYKCLSGEDAFDLYVKYSGKYDIKVEGLYKGMANGFRYNEGVSKKVECSWALYDLVNYLCEGMRSGISYVGGRNIEDLQNLAEFIKVSRASYVEGKPNA